MPCVSDALRAAWQCQWQSTMSVTFNAPIFPWLYVHAGLDPLRFNLNPKMSLCYKMAEHITAAFLTVLTSILNAAALCNMMYLCGHQGAGIALIGRLLQQSEHLML